MKKLLILILLLLSINTNFAQVDFTGAMGINFVNTSSFNDYLNITAVNNDEQLSSFVSTINFMGEAGYYINPAFQVAVEYVYEFYSITPAAGKVSYYKSSYNHHKPSVIAYYVIPGNGYKLKIGAGAGLRIVSIDEQFSNTPSAVERSTAGFGAVLKAQGYTLLSGNFYANIGADLRYDMPGEPENDGSYIFDRTINENVNLNSISFGVHLGVAYLID